MTLKDLLTSIGVSVTEEQYEALASRVTLKTNKSSGKTGGTYSYLSSSFGPKTPTQMRTCVNVLMKLGSATMEQWAVAAGDVLVTRQDPAKVIAFYRKRMLDEGLIVLGVAQQDKEEHEYEDEEEHEDEYEDEEEQDDTEPVNLDDDMEEIDLAGVKDAYQESRVE